MSEQKKDCRNDFSGGEGIITVVEGDNMVIKLTKASRYYGVNATTTRTSWGRHIELINKENNMVKSNATKEYKLGDVVDISNAITPISDGRHPEYSNGKLFIYLGDDDYAKKGEVVKLTNNDDTGNPFFTQLGKRENNVCFYWHELAELPKDVKIEEVKPNPQFVRLSRNTELFKKGSVFQLNNTYYTPANGANDGGVFIDENAGNVANYNVPTTTVLRLPNTFVPVIKFNPAYVTEEENTRLQAALAKKPTKKGKK